MDIAQLEQQTIEKKENSYNTITKFLEIFDSSKYDPVFHEHVLKIKHTVGIAYL